jgi:hypothetical protein
MIKEKKDYDTGLDVGLIISLVIFDFLLNNHIYLYWSCLLTMHPGRPGSTKGPCFTSKEYMHMVRPVTYTIKIITYL